MKEKLNKLKARYEELGRLLSAPDAMNDMAAWKEMNRERRCSASTWTPT